MLLQSVHTSMDGMVGTFNFRDDTIHCFYQLLMQSQSFTPEAVVSLAAGHSFRCCSLFLLPHFGSEVWEEEEEEWRAQWHGGGVSLS